MKELTARQRQVLDAIVSYRTEKGYAPSIRELGPMLGISSLRGVTIHLDALERKGYIERESTSRSIRVVAGEGATQAFRSIPVISTIAAGLPLLAEVNVETHVPIPEGMAPKSGELFALQVKGDSMIGDHVLDGDTVVVRSQPTAEDGEIVAALLGDEATVKRLNIGRDGIRLLPSNPGYPPIELHGENTRILGKVIGLIRSYKA